MKFFKNKLVLISPIMAFLVIFIFSLALFPSVQIKPKNMPIAIVNADQGIDIPNQGKVNMGQTIVEMIQKNSSPTSDEEPAIKWLEVNNIEEVQNGLNKQNYYAALVIPEDFSAKQASLSSPTPNSPEVQIFINQGMNTAASTMAGQILNGVVDNMNNNVRTQIVEGLKKKGATLTVEQASVLVSPITKTVTNVNEIGTKSANGNSLFPYFNRFGWQVWRALRFSFLLLAR